MRIDKMIWDGKSYDGEIRNNHPNGHGRLIGEYGVVYEGNFYMGKYHGEGQYYLIPGDYGDVCYCKGVWDNGHRTGYFEFFDKYDESLGFKKYDNNGILIQVQIKYSNGKIFIRNSFLFDEDENVIGIQCKCGSWKTEWTKTQSAGFLAAEKYELWCNDCDYECSDIKRGELVK